MKPVDDMLATILDFEPVPAAEPVVPVCGECWELTKCEWYFPDCYTGEPIRCRVCGRDTCVQQDVTLPEADRIHAALCERLEAER